MHVAFNSSLHFSHRPCSVPKFGHPIRAL
jgi:hypothetical protein